jgi:glycosyltransferase involved in cell wall biosynthesis
MKLTIITINYNNAAGLKKTMESVLNQTSRDFEYIVVDGMAPLNPPDRGTLRDREVIESCLEKPVVVENGFNPCTWLSPSGGVGGGFYSEPDSGIYNAMNKGISMAKGEYVQFLNSGDVLAAPDVTERMLSVPLSLGVGLGARSILYGNMLKPYKGKIIHDRGFAGRVPTMLDFYTGTLNHSPAYIERNLFETYGLYDESLKIVSDYKWYVKVIAIQGIVPVYVDIDVTIFDMSGISTVNSSLDKAERRKVLEDLLPLSVLLDYELYAFPIEQLKRMNRYWITRKGFWLVERILFKWEKIVGSFIVGGV